MDLTTPWSPHSPGARTRGCYRRGQGRQGPRHLQVPGGTGLPSRVLGPREGEVQQLTGCIGDGLARGGGDWRPHPPPVVHSVPRVPSAQGSGYTTPKGPDALPAPGRRTPSPGSGLPRLRTPPWSPPVSAGLPGSPGKLCLGQRSPAPCGSPRILRTSSVSGDTGFGVREVLWQSVRTAVTECHRPGG